MIFYQNAVCGQSQWCSAVLRHQSVHFGVIIMTKETRLYVSYITSIMWPQPVNGKMIFSMLRMKMPLVVHWQDKVVTSLCCCMFDQCYRIISQSCILSISNFIKSLLILNTVMEGWVSDPTYATLALNIHEIVIHVRYVRRQITTNKTLFLIEVNNIHKLNECFRTLACNFKKNHSAE